MGLRTVLTPQRRPNLGRQLVHDPRSRSFSAFPADAIVDRSKWVTKSIRIYDPTKNPNQCHGECTGCAKSMEMNALGNRVKGIVFDMTSAHTLYHLSTTLDPFDGEWPPDDSGSSGLGAAKAAKQWGIGGEYRHIFGGADEVVQLICQGRVVNVGTWWYDGMFFPNPQGVIEPVGPQVGGHQYLARGYNVLTDRVLIRCWWGSYRDVWIKREHLNELLLDDGDAHIQNRIVPF